MRLIDADALLKSHCVALNGEYESCKECLEPPYGCCCLEIMGQDVNNATIVPAIPIEWLENRLANLFFEAMGGGALYGDRIAELANSINNVIKLWQNEQAKQ